jgi:hypothetical protein
MTINAARINVKVLFLPSISSKTYPKFIPSSCKIESLSAYLSGNIKGAKNIELRTLRASSKFLARKKIQDILIKLNVMNQARMVCIVKLSFFQIL